MTVASPTAKQPNLSPRQYFRLYGILHCTNETQIHQNSRTHCGTILLRNTPNHLISCRATILFDSFAMDNFCILQKKEIDQKLVTINRNSSYSRFVGSMVNLKPAESASILTSIPLLLGTHVGAGANNRLCTSKRCLLHHSYKTKEK